MTLVTQCLMHASLCMELGMARRRALVSALTRHDHADGECIVRQGEAADKLFVLVCDPKPTVWSTRREGNVG